MDTLFEDAPLDDDWPNNNESPGAPDIEVNVSSQSLEVIPPVVVSVYPTTLVASFNKISSLDVASFGDLLSGLVRLDLSHNALSGALPPLGSAAPRLEVLNISFNSLTTLSVVEGCSTLRELWVNDNALGGALATVVLPLVDLQLLSVLALHNNPCVDTRVPVATTQTAVEGADDPRVLYIVRACSGGSLRQLSVSVPRVTAAEALAGGTLADGGDGLCAAVGPVAVVTVTPALVRAAFAWHDSFSLTTPPLRHLVSATSLVRSGSTRSLLGLPTLPVNQTVVEAARARTAKTPRTASSMAGAAGALPSARTLGGHLYRYDDLGPDAGPLQQPTQRQAQPLPAPLAHGDDVTSFRYPYFGPPPGLEHVPPYNLGVAAAPPPMTARFAGPETPPAPLSAGTVARLARKLSRGDSLGSLLPPPASARAVTAGPASVRRLPGLASPPAAAQADVALGSPALASSRRPATTGAGHRAAAAALPPLSASPAPPASHASPPRGAALAASDLQPSPVFSRVEAEGPSPAVRPHRLSTFVGVDATPAPEGAGILQPQTPARALEPAAPLGGGAGASVAAAAAAAPTPATREAAEAPAAARVEGGVTANSAGTAAPSSSDGGGFCVTFAGDVIRPAAPWTRETALRVEADGSAYALWPGGRVALSVMVDDKATEALRAFATGAGLAEDETAALVAQSAYGVVAYPRETAPLVVDVNEDAVAGACVAVDGFGVGFVAAVPAATPPAAASTAALLSARGEADGAGAAPASAAATPDAPLRASAPTASTLVHLAEDGSGFHADERGVVQRRWGPRGDVTFVAPAFVPSDLTALAALGAAAAAQHEAAASGPAGSSSGDSGGRGSDADPGSPRGEAGRDADRASLRRSLLEHLFPGSDIPPLAARAPVSYLRSPCGVGFLLGAGLAAYVDVDDRFVKLFLACRAFRYELVVAPGVPAGLGAAKELAATPAPANSEAPT